MTAVAENILLNVESTLGGITTDNEYAFEMASVERFEVGGNTLASLPAAVVSSGEKRRLTETSRTMEWNFDVDVAVYVMHDKAADTRSTDEVLTEVEAEVYRALMADPTRGGYALHTEITRLSHFNLMHEEGFDTGVLAELSIRFRHDRMDPRVAV